MHFANCRDRAYATSTTTSEFGKLTVPSILFEGTVRRVQEIFEAEIREYQNKEKIVQTWAPDIMRRLRGNFPRCYSQFIKQRNKTQTTLQHDEVIARFLLTGLIIFTTKNTNKAIKANPKKKFL